MRSWTKTNIYNLFIEKRSTPPLWANCVARSSEWVDDHDGWKAIVYF